MMWGVDSPVMDTFLFLWKTCFGYRINAFNDVDGDGSNGVNKGMLMVLCWYLQLGNDADYVYGIDNGG